MFYIKYIDSICLTVILLNLFPTGARDKMHSSVIATREYKLDTVSYIGPVLLYNV